MNEILCMSAILLIKGVVSEALKYTCFLSPALFGTLVS